MGDVLVRVQEYLARSGLNLVAAVLIFVVGRILARVLRNILRRAMDSRKVDATLVSFVTHLGYAALMTFVIIAALARLGIQTGSFIAVLGAAGLAVGLALQGSLANFAAGVLMILFRPFNVGDFIEGAGVSGVVREIGIFHTELTSPDNKKIIIPNAKLTGDNIINYTAEEKRRVDLVVGVSYEDDLDKVKRVLEEILASDERILKDPAPTVGVLELGESSVNFAVRPWVRTNDYWDVYFYLQETIKKRFDEAGLSIPYPQQDLHLTGSLRMQREGS